MTKDDMFKVSLYVLLIPYHEVPVHIVLAPFLAAPLTDFFVPIESTNKSHMDSVITYFMQAYVSKLYFSTYFFIFSP